MAGYALKKVVRMTSNNQVVIPAPIARRLKLVKGSYLEVEEKDRKIVMKPKQLVDEEDFAMYEEMIKKGRMLHRKGETVDWEEVKKKLGAEE